MSSADSIHTFQNKNSEYSKNFFRILTDDFPEEKYKPKEKDQDRSSVHYGQRKLFLSEVEFLTNVCCQVPKEKLFKKIVIIYAGAAPGIHIDFLNQLFPFMYFVLVDPAKMAVKTSEKIRIHQEYFTDETAQSLKKEFQHDLILFISDIRRFGPGAKLTDSEIEEEIVEDMRNQKNWFKILNPFRALLKFRLPYVENRTNAQRFLEYLDGDVYFQIWPPNSSSETRLYVKENAGLKEYDCIKYENQLYRFNNNERVMCYEHEYLVDGLDHCYDCRAELYVFENYLENFSKIEALNRKVKITKLKVEDYVKQLNHHLEADKKFLRFSYNKQEYQIKFTEIKYGKKVEDLFIDENLAKNKFNKWEKRTFHFDHQKTKIPKNDMCLLKKRLNSTVIKRLNK
ncbi:unnamed protein product [Brachionus calyciflorus]|uniref:Cap-specific mRNA (nucleoside-2'-O-)-methyltransferase n=1 Tax=Brachionus calyciflorus TaxID=104777 RepID=A0A814EUF1_9BILA|nr:unnamed protein product [Brachionus calyciflorus]